MPSRLASRSVCLRPVRGSDSEWLYELLVGDRGPRWRYRGRTPNPAEFEADLWRSVYSQWVVADRHERPMGLVGLYNHRPAVAAAHMFAAGAVDCGPLVSEAAGLLLDWGFKELDLDKIWIEAPEFNLAQFRSIDSVADVEGRLRDFDHWRGRFWDLFILSIKRDRWESSRVGQIVHARSEPIAASEGVGVAELESELSALFCDQWPLDSLGRVEALTILEEAKGQQLDDEVLDSVTHLDPVSAAAALSRSSDSS